VFFQFEFRIHGGSWLGFFESNLKGGMVPLLSYSLYEYGHVDPILKMVSPYLEDQTEKGWLIVLLYWLSVVSVW